MGSMAGNTIANTVQSAVGNSTTSNGFKPTNFSKYTTSVPSVPTQQQMFPNLSYMPTSYNNGASQYLGNLLGSPINYNVAIPTYLSNIYKPTQTTIPLQNILSNNTSNLSPVDLSKGGIGQYTISTGQNLAPNMVGVSTVGK
jgi:hypothetical protein